MTESVEVSGLYIQAIALPYVKHNAPMSLGVSSWIMSEGERRGYWKPGSRLLDPMIGVGNGAIPWITSGYSVTGVEVEPDYAETCSRRLDDAMRGSILANGASWSVLNGDCRDVLSRLHDDGCVYDVCVTSPPYGNTLTPGSEGPYATAVRTPEEKRELLVTRRDPKLGAYGRADGQLSLLGLGEFWPALVDIYAQVRVLLRPGGFIVTVTKDYVANRQRVSVKDEMLSVLRQAGFDVVLEARALGAPGGIWKKLANKRFRASGRPDLVVEHEDILFCQVA